MGGWFRLRRRHGSSDVEKAVDLMPDLSRDEASTAARRHLADLHSGEYADRPDPGFYPRGCLARFAVVDGTAQEAQR